MKVFCSAGHGETPGQQVFLGRSGSLVPWLLPKGVRRFDLKVSLQTGSPGACSPVACPCWGSGTENSPDIGYERRGAAVFQGAERGKYLSLQYLEAAEGVCGGTTLKIFEKF